MHWSYSVLHQCRFFFFWDTVYYLHFKWSAAPHHKEEEKYLELYKLEVNRLLDCKYAVDYDNHCVWRNDLDILTTDLVW